VLVHSDVPEKNSCHCPNFLLPEKAADAVHSSTKVNKVWYINCYILINYILIKGASEKQLLNKFSSNNW